MSVKRPDLRQAEAAPSRRAILGGGVGTATAAAAAVVAPVLPASAAESDADKKKARYQETDHVKTYYRTNRY